MLIDVLVIGGGPAGLYAAQLLARRGLVVRVLEAHQRIGDPVHCTGIVGTEAFRLPGIPQSTILARPRAGRFHSPAGLSLSYVGSEGEVCVVDRGVFDRELAAGALRAGAEITTGARGVELDVGPDGARVHAWAGGALLSVSARVCLLACGASYVFQRRLGWGLPPLLLSSAQTELAATPAEALDVFFRRELGPGGFGWLVPIDRDGEPRAKVGVMALSRARVTVGRMVRELAAEGRVSGPADPVVARLLPLGPLPRTYADRVLAIGDAAGLVKPTTGGGIYYSLLSARWAAETVVAAFERGDFSRRTLGRYEETWRKHLGPELKVGVWFRRIVEHLTAADVDALVELAIKDGVMPVVHRTARFNWHRELILQTLRHPGVLQIVFRRLLGVGLSA